MQLNDVLLVETGIPDSTEIFEMPLSQTFISFLKQASCRDFIAKLGIAVDVAKDEAYGLEEALTKWAKKVDKSYIDKIKPTTKYAVKTLYADEPNRWIEKCLRQIYNTDEIFSFIDIKPYHKKVNNTIVKVLMPKTWTEQNLEDKFDKESMGRGKVIFSNLEDSFDYKSLPEYQRFERSFNEDTTPDILKKETHRFILDPNDGRKGAPIRMTIHGNGYVRVDDGSTQAKVITSPTGGADEERKRNAYKQAMIWARKHRYL